MRPLIVPTYFTATEDVTKTVKYIQGIVGGSAKAMKQSFAGAFGAFATGGGFGSMAKGLSNIGDKMMLGIKPWMLWAGGIYAARSELLKILDVGSKFEMARAEFMPFFGGDTGQAQKMVDRIQSEVIKSNYSFGTIKDVVSQFMPTFGGDQERAFAMYKMLGNTARGNEDLLRRQVLGTNKAFLMQKITQESLKILAEANIPIYNEMAKSMYGNKNATKQLFEAVTKGKVPLDILQKALENMTAKGGMFYNAQEYGAKTVTGQWKSMGEMIDIIRGKIYNSMTKAFEKLMPKLLDYITRLTKWFDTHQADVDAFFTSIFTGVEKAIAGIEKWAKNGGLEDIKVMFQGIKSLFVWFGENSDWLAPAIATYIKAIPLIYGLSYAFAAVNLAMTANPAVLLAYGIVLLTVAIVAIMVKWDDWGKKVQWMLGPLGALLTFIMDIKDNFLVFAHTLGDYGFFGVFIGLGKIIINSILHPLQLSLQAWGELTGSQGTIELARSIASARGAMGYKNDLMGTGKDQVVKDSEQYTRLPFVAQSMQTFNKNISTETSQKNTVKIEVTSKDPRIDIKAKMLGSNIPFSLNNSMSAFDGD